jgi:hypothetical protein
MTLACSLLLSLVPQVLPGGDLKLPPAPAKPKAAQPAARPASELERFRRDLAELQGPAARVEQKLQAMGEAYAPATMEALVIEVARSARANEMVSLTVVARRFGPQLPRVGDELLFQLLARPLGEATRPVVEAMVALKGPQAKAALYECIRGRIPAARRQATDALLPLLDAADLDFAIALSREQSLDLQLRGVELLRALPEPRAASRLCELLAKDAALAAAACQALVAMGGPAVPALQALLASPPVDRSQAYAAFALAQLGDAQGAGAVLVPAAGLPVLAASLRHPEPLTRCLVAIPLADALYRGEAAPVGDAAVVEALFEIVQPQQFVPNLELLRRPAEARLLRITGRLPAIDRQPWREWWTVHRETFLGVRATVAVDATNAGSAIVSVRSEQRHVRLLGEEMADLAVVPGAVEVVLGELRMLELVRALGEAGFGDAQAMAADAGLPAARVLQVQVPDGRAQVAVPAVPHPRFDRLVALVDAAIDEEAWQLYRRADVEPDRGAFWRAERRWREANPDEIERGRRFLQRAVAGWAQLSTPLRARALAWLSGHPERKRLLAEQDGERMLAVLEALPELGELDLRLLELAAAAPGPSIWRRAVAIAAQKPGGGPAAVRGVFGGLGPDAVLEALAADDPVLRRAGIDQLLLVRDQRAADRLVQLLRDPEPDVAIAAAAACGHLPVAAAARPLVEIITADETLPAMRQECLRALGRVGGELAFPVLQRALMATDMDYKEAAMRGLADLRDPRAAHVLADLIVIGHGKDLGAMARHYLQRQSGTFAVPALRAQLQIAQDPAIRDTLVLLLGSYHDAGIVPDLIDMLRRPQLAAQAAALLEGTTGLSLAAAPDRIGVAEAWYRQHKNAPQWQWLLEALAAAGVATTLRPEHFALGRGLGPVAELTRLLVEVESPRLWALTGAVLRSTAGEDYGIVTLATSRETREAIAARYRVLVEAARTAEGR